MVRGLTQVGQGKHDVCHAVRAHIVTTKAQCSHSASGRSVGATQGRRRRQRARGPLFPSIGCARISRGGQDMAIDLMDLVKGHLTPDVIQQAASSVGESNGATQKALAGIVPALLAGLANTGSTSAGIQRLMGMLDTGKYDGSAL